MLNSLSLKGRGNMLKRWAILIFGISFLAGCSKKADALNIVLAEVNGEKVTLKEFNKELNNLPPQQKSIYENDKIGFLEELITRKILLQEAKRKNIGGSSDDILIQKLIESVIDTVKVLEVEIKNFYEEHKNELGEKTFQEVRYQLEPMVRQDKQQKIFEDWLEGLKSKAQIKRNDKWIKKEQAKLGINPLDEALKTGRPVLADFGRGICVPCKMMKPILDELKKEYQGKAEILIIEIDEYSAITRKERIRLIPTQIFFDKAGKEVYRHEGFMDKEAIKKRLKEMGVE